MIGRKPHVAVFFGGTSDSYDLSEETGYWVCQYAPRETYRVTPVRVLPDGKWQVPLGSLPQQGSVGGMLRYLFEGVTPVIPQQGLDRLLRQPVQGIMTVIRGAGGDDGALHGLAQSLSIPMIGAPLNTCQQTSDKFITSQLLEDVIHSPQTRRFGAKDDPTEIVDEIRKTFVPPLFVKPVTQESSVGVEEVGSIDELRAAVIKAQTVGDILIQKKAVGTEVSVTLFDPAPGKLTVLPPTVIKPVFSSFYDRLAKRSNGRVKLTTQDDDNAMLQEVKEVAANAYQKLGAKGVLSFDMSVSKQGTELLEVNSIPTLTQMTPLVRQLSAAGVHPSGLVDSLFKRAVE